MKPSWIQSSCRTFSARFKERSMKYEPELTGKWPVIMKLFLYYEAFPALRSFSCFTKHFLCYEVFPSLQSFSFVTKLFLHYKVFPALRSFSCIMKHKCKSTHYAKCPLSECCIIVSLYQYHVCVCISASTRKTTQRFGPTGSFISLQNKSADS